MLPTPDTSHVSFDTIYEPSEDSYLFLDLSLIHISEPTRRNPTSYAVFRLKKKKKKILCAQ